MLNLASKVGAICFLLFASFLGTIQPVQYRGDLNGLTNCTPETVKQGVEKAKADLQSVCGVEFVEGPGGITFEVGPTKPYSPDGRAYAALTLGNRIILGSDDPRNWNAQKVFTVARHEICHTPRFNLYFPSNPWDPIHSADPKSPMSADGYAGAWDAESVRQLQAKFGKPVQPVKLTRLEAAKKILDSEEGRRAKIQRWYLAYLFRGCDEAGFKWWLGVWQRDGQSAVESGILASEEAWVKAGSQKAGWLGHLWRTALGYEPKWASVEYWAGQMQ